MISENLFQEILLNPAKNGGTELLVVSGYATGRMAQLHLDDPEIRETDIRVRVVHGMAFRDGVWEIDHRQFTELARAGHFECHYRIRNPAIHSKVYVWLARGVPLVAFAGSANYTMTGFGRIPGTDYSQNEVMVQVHPTMAKNYFETVLNGAMEIDHADIAEHINIRPGTPAESPQNDEEHQTISLLTHRGRGNKVAGLNWVLDRRGGPGKRNPAGGYIQIGASLGRSDFFPPRPEPFELRTDDGEYITVVRAQKSSTPKTLPPSSGDAIETNPNHVLGLYFRRRLGLADDAYIEPHHLQTHGRSDVTFIKIDEERFIMDFNPRRPDYEP